MGGGICIPEKERDLEAEIRAEDLLDEKRERRKSRHMEQKTLALNYTKDYIFGYCPIMQWVCVSCVLRMRSS